jgi:RES domain-containing protein
MDGQGAARHPGRWNALGVPVVYSATSYAGALLEQLVHANIGHLPPRVFVTITVPAGLAVTVEEGALHAGWEAEDCLVSRAVGAAWISARATVALLVPSRAGAPIEQTVVLNPSHPDFVRLVVSTPRSVTWDQRFHNSE